MMRGLSTAFALGAAYMAGWALFLSRWNWAARTTEAAIVACVVAVFIASLVRASRSFGVRYREPIDRLLLAIIAALLFGAGYEAAALWNTTSGTLPVFVACFFAYLAIALRFLVLYRYFAVEFAKAVWTSFAVEPAKRPDKT